MMQVALSFVESTDLIEISLETNPVFSLYWTHKSNDEPN
jgi:hypothetical protein